MQSQLHHPPLVVDLDPVPFRELDVRVPVALSPPSDPAGRSKQDNENVTIGGRHTRGPAGVQKNKGRLRAKRQDGPER